LTLDFIAHCQLRISIDLQGKDQIRTSLRKQCAMWNWQWAMPMLCSKINSHMRHERLIEITKQILDDKYPDADVIFWPDRC